MDQDKQILLEQYKLYVEMADRVTERRGKFNQYCITLISGILGITTYLLHQDQKELVGEHPAFIIAIASFITSLISVLWLYQILYSKNLNSAKFQVITEMEAQLPVQGFNKEWELYFLHGEKRFTHLERWIPQIILIISCITFVISFFVAFG